VDLDASAVTVYSDPRDGSYQVVRPKHKGESIAPHLLPECSIAVVDLLAE
jgi:hypothetical protein